MRSNRCGRGRLRTYLSVYPPVKKLAVRKEYKVAENVLQWARLLVVVQAIVVFKRPCSVLVRNDNELFRDFLAT